MREDKIERFFCNVCKGTTKHFIRGEFEKHEDHVVVWYQHRFLIVECCGCENLELIKMSLFSEDIEEGINPQTGEEETDGSWDVVIYPPVTYRSPPTWFEDLPDLTLRAISDEIYKSLQTGSHYLATFGSRTLIDRLIVLTVGDKGNFYKGLQALQNEGKLSQHERDILNPVVDAGNAAAHRGWAPTKDQLAVILDTVEGLIHRLLVLPKLAEELDGAVPARQSYKSARGKSIANIEDKIEEAPEALRSVYNALSEKLKSFGSDVSVHPQKHYMAFRRNRNFASVQIYNTKRLTRLYLNVDPDEVTLVPEWSRDVRQIGHFGTGDLEITIKSEDEIELAFELMLKSYQAS